MYKVVSVPYFLDEMQDYEVNECIENIPYMDRNRLEGDRMISYVVAQVNNKKKLTPQDIISFAWEKQETETNYEITNEDIDRLKKKSAQIINNKAKTNGSR